MALRLEIPPQVLAFTSPAQQGLISLNRFRRLRSVLLQQLDAEVPESSRAKLRVKARTRLRDRVEKRVAAADISPQSRRLSHFATAELPTVESPNLAAALLLDPDGDGLNNFMEYCFGRLPKTADNTQPLTTPGRINVGGSDYLTVTFVRAKNALDVTYQVEASSDLVNPNSWSNVGILVSKTDLGNGREQVTYRDNTPISTGSRSLHVRAFKP